MTDSTSDRARLLIIDPSVDVHRLVKIRLRDQNLDVISAVSGDEGLAMARDRNPDLILLDLHLPDMSGFDVLRTLKDDPQTIEIPVIFLSDAADSTEKVRGFDLGAVDFVTKPFDMAELRARVRAALRTQRLVQMLAQRAQLDGLTGLWNRAHLDQRLEECVQHAIRHGRPLSLILCDIDNFKQINDQFGHPFGDRVLQETARILEHGGRLADIACRYGGEEFAVILPETSLNEAVQVAERFRAAFEGTVWPERDDLKVTASFGVSDLDCISRKEPTALISAADRALYRAKTEGRNHVIRAETDGAMPFPKQRTA